VIDPSVLTYFADLSRIGSSALVAAIWQGALLAAAAALALRLVPRIPAAARFAIWFAVFLLIAALPFAAFPPHVPASHTAASGTHAWFNFDSRWTLAIAILWAVASLFRAATLISAALRVRSLSRKAIAVELPPALTMPRRAQLCLSHDVDRPTVIGFLSPKILLPAWLLEKLTPAELEHVILHESSHLNRADDWLNLLQKFAVVLFPLNPALAWVERRLCFERELACDERVLNELRTRAGASIGYASSLTTLAEHSLRHRGLVRNLALALGALGRESELGRRVARILRPATRMKPLHVRLATGAAIAALLFTTTQLEHSPQLISFTSPESRAQLASSQSVEPVLITGYKAVATSLTLPAPQQMKPVVDAAPHRTAQSPATEPRAISVRATDNSTQAQQPTARMVSVREPAQQPDLVITNYSVTTWQSSDGYRVVRTSAVISDAPQANTSDWNAPDQNKRATTSPRVRQISQPYAVMPVPGGWLVFEL